jgi:hypothetical protein
MPAPTPAYTALPQRAAARASARGTTRGGDEHPGRADAGERSASHPQREPGRPSPRSAPPWRQRQQPSAPRPAAARGVSAPAR